MKIIPIPRKLLNHKQNYIFADGKFDFIGCILFENGIDIPEKTKLPSDLKLELPLFTRIIRRRYVDTALTQKIITLDVHPQENALAEANKLLFPHYELRIVER